MPGPVHALGEREEAVLGFLGCAIRTAPRTASAPKSNAPGLFVGDGRRSIGGRCVRRWASPVLRTVYLISMTTNRVKAPGVLRAGNIRGNLHLSCLSFSA